MDSGWDTACKRWVSPFGNPRIKACSQLPTAYRSVPRPSSPPRAKASTRCPYLALEIRHIAMTEKAGPTTKVAASPSGHAMCDRPMQSYPHVRVSSPFTLSKNASPIGRTPERSLLRSGHRPMPVTAWWSQPGSNRRPPACKAGALPAELWPRSTHPTRSADRRWWARVDSNHRPHAYQACALTT